MLVAPGRSRPAEGRPWGSLDGPGHAGSDNGDRSPPGLHASAVARSYDAVLDRRLSYCKARERNGRALETHVANARVKESAAGIQISKADKTAPTGSTSLCTP